MAIGAPASGLSDVALQRRQKLMGASGPAALVKNFRVFSIALFACIGGLLYVCGSIDAVSRKVFKYGTDSEYVNYRGIIRVFSLVY